MDASRLTRLRREQASQWLSTRKTVDASERTKEVKLANSRVLKDVKTAIQTTCCDKRVETSGSAIQVLGGSYDAVLLRNASVSECCLGAKPDKLQLPVDCYVPEANPVRTTKTTPCFSGTRLNPGETKTAPNCCP